MILKKRPLHRWLCSINACWQARGWIMQFRTFDQAWKVLDDPMYIWWLGESLLDLGFNWDDDDKFGVEDKEFNVTTSFENPKVRRKLKRHIRRRVEARYRAFLKSERRAK